LFWGCKQSETAEPVVTPITTKPLSIFILSPLNDDTNLQGEEIYFSADIGEESLADNQVIWTSNLDGEIGHTPSFKSSHLSEGMHSITATLKDPMGNEASHSLIVTVEKFTHAAHYKKHYDLNPRIGDEAIDLKTVDRILRTTKNFDRKNLSGLDLSGKKFSGISFADAFMVHTNFSNCEFKNVNLKNARIDHANLSNAKLRQVNLTNVERIQNGQCQPLRVQFLSDGSFLCGLVQRRAQSGQL
jgi:hypothetical protein